MNDSTLIHFGALKRILWLLSQYQPIQAIKTLREDADLDLKEAKDMVDAIRDLLPVGQDKRLEDMVAELETTIWNTIDVNYIADNLSYRERLRLVKTILKRKLNRMACSLDR